MNIKNRWIQAAQDRLLWETLEEAYIHLWTSFSWHDDICKLFYPTRKEGL